MGVEIERKFLVADDTWRESVASSTRIVQGYLASSGRATVRVRVKGDHGYLTVKGATSGVTRAEFEFEIPVGDALAMLDSLADGPVIDKVRHLIPAGRQTWELDVFEGPNAGLVMAEIELSADDEAFTLPGWVGAEVSDDPRYLNVNLVREPYGTWARG